jgi:hypothetical protein
VDNDWLSAMTIDSRGRVFVGLALLDRDGAGVRSDASIRRLTIPRQSIF